MKYRIIEVNEFVATYYLLQVKTFLFWRTAEDGSVDDIGIYSYPKKFNTSDDAYHHYLKFYKKPQHKIIIQG